MLKGCASQVVRGGRIWQSSLPNLFDFVQAREVAETEEELVLLRMQEREDALAARAVATELLCVRAIVLHALQNAMHCLTLCADCRPVHKF